VAESPGVISAFGEPSSEPETALRTRRRALSLPLEEPLEELLDELLDEPLAVSSDLDPARRSLGRSGSLSLDELLVLSAELDAPRRNVGWSPLLLPDEATEALLAERLEELLLEEDEPSEDLLGSGRDGSSVASDAIECSSGVPAVTIVILTAW
jgi:hypothetical protein